MSHLRPWLVPPLPGVYVRRSAAYWALLHLLLAAMLLAFAMFSGRTVNPFDLLPGGSPFLVLVVGALGMLEARRRDEDLFLANLGYGWGTIAAYLAAPAATLEAAFTVGRFGWATAGAYVALPGKALEMLLAGWR